MILNKKMEGFIMIIKDFIGMVNKEKKKREQAEAAKKIAVGMGTVAAVGIATGILFATKLGKETRKDLKIITENTIGSIKKTAQKKADAVKDSAANVAWKVHNVIEDVNEKTEGVKKDIKDGRNEITQDIHKTVENISNELNKSVG